MVELSALRFKAVLFRICDDRITEAFTCEVEILDADMELLVMCDAFTKALCSRVAFTPVELSRVLLVSVDKISVLFEIADVDADD